MSTGEQRVTVTVPDGIPTLTCEAIRTLLGILVELTTVELLDDVPDGDHDGC